MAGSMKEYLKRYKSSTDAECPVKANKKEEEKHKSAAMGGLLIVDEDPVWQNRVQIEEQEEDSDSAGEKQQEKYIKEKHMKKMETISPSRREKKRDRAEVAGREKSPCRREKKRDRAEVAEREKVPCRREKKRDHAELAERGKEVTRKAGLFTKEEIREENRKMKELERSRITLMLKDPSISGKGAEPVFRDRRGRRISKESMLIEDKRTRKV